MAKKHWGKVAAGVLPFNTVDCKVLLQHRSDDVQEPDTWGIIGGAISKNQTLTGCGEQFEEIGVSEDAIVGGLVHEFEEETGGDKAEMKRVSKFHVFRDGGFEYHSYAAELDRKIDPPTREDDGVAYWESKGYKWVDVESLIDVARSQKGGDMTPFKKIFKDGAGLHPSLSDTLNEAEVQTKLRGFESQCAKRRRG